jgi:hypothetical protein
MRGIAGGRASILARRCLVGSGEPGGTARNRWREPVGGPGVERCRGVLGASVPLAGGLLSLVGGAGRSRVIYVVHLPCGASLAARVSSRGVLAESLPGRYGVPGVRRDGREDLL